MNYTYLEANPYGKNEPFENGLKGIKINEKWNDEYINLIHSQNIKILFLNYVHGWDCDNYSFLSKIDKLRTLDIVDVPRKKNSFIDYQTDLVKLKLGTHITENIDFTKFTQLEDCFTYWSKHVKTVLEVKTLKRLYIDKIKEDYSVGLGNLTNMKKLIIASSNLRSLEFLTNMSETLETLELLDCRKIEDFRPITNMRNLKRLRIDGYKDISNLDFVYNLENLEVLLIDAGNINSIKGIENLKKLKAVSICGTKTNIVDGDLTQLTKLPQLSMAMIGSKKHYSHKVIKQWNWENFNSPDKILEKK